MNFNLHIIEIDNFEGLIMIHSLYIMNPAGICIYSEHFIKSRIDEQLLTGFLTAIGSFSKEAIGGALQKLNIKTGEQMVMFYHEESKLTIAAIANANDHNTLLEDLLNKIVSEFYKTYKKNLKEQGLFEDTTQFSKTCQKILRGKVLNRGKKQLFLGVFLGLLLLVVLAVFTIIGYFVLSILFSGGINWVVAQFNAVGDSIIQILKVEDPVVGFTIHHIVDTFFNKVNAMQPYFLIMSFWAQLLLFFSFIPSALLGGYIAGSRDNGKWLGFLFFGFAIILFLLFTPDFVYLILAFLPLILICSFTFGYLGGLFREKRRLYPLPSEQKLDSGIKPERTRLTKLEYIFAIVGPILFVAGLQGNGLLLIGLIMIILAIIFEIKERRRS